MTKAKKDEVQMMALPGKTIQLAVSKGRDGDKNKGIPKIAPRIRTIQPKTQFVCTKAEADALINQKAAMLVSDLPKTVTDQEKTDASAKAAAADADATAAAEKAAADAAAAAAAGDAAGDAGAGDAPTGLPSVK